MSDFMVGKYLIFSSFANVHEFPFTKIVWPYNEPVFYYLKILIQKFSNLRWWIFTIRIIINLLLRFFIGAVPYFTSSLEDEHVTIKTQTGRRQVLRPAVKHYKYALTNWIYYWYLLFVSFYLRGFEYIL